MAAQPQPVSGSQWCRENPYTGGPVTALWFEHGSGVVERQFDDLESAEAATDAQADEATSRGKKFRAELRQRRKLLSKIRYLGFDLSENPSGIHNLSEPMPAWAVFALDGEPTLEAALDRVEVLRARSLESGHAAEPGVVTSPSEKEGVSYWACYDVPSFLEELRTGAWHASIAKRYSKGNPWPFSKSTPERVANPRSKVIRDPKQIAEVLSNLDEEYFLRVHWSGGRKFSERSAWSRPWGDEEAGPQRGFSSFSTSWSEPWKLRDYFVGRGFISRGEPVEEWVYIYTGTRVGTGPDNEDLSVPDGRITIRTPWEVYKEACAILESSTEQNPWPFSKSTPECATKPSGMNLASALTAARKAGAEMGDTGLFDQWLCASGLHARGGYLRGKLEAEFRKGVEGEPVDQEAARYKGVGIHRTGDEYYTDLDPETRFEDVKLAKAFIGEWKKKSNPELDAKEFYRLGYARGEQDRSSANVGLSIDPDIKSKESFDFVFERARQFRRFTVGQTESVRRSFLRGYYDAYSERPRHWKRGNPSPSGKEPWQMTQREYCQFYRANYQAEQSRVGNFPNLAHKNEVREALESGKPVPPEVLADYPDLKRGNPVEYGGALEEADPVEAGRKAAEFYNRTRVHPDQYSFQRFVTMWSKKHKIPKDEAVASISQGFKETQKTRGMGNPRPPSLRHMPKREDLIEEIVSQVFLAEMVRDTSPVPKEHLPMDALSTIANTKGTIRDRGYLEGLPEHKLQTALWQVRDAVRQIERANERWKAKGNPARNGRRLTAVITPQRESDGPSYRVEPITGPEGMIYVEGAFPTQVQAERTVLEAVREALRNVEGEYQVEFLIDGNGMHNPGEMHLYKPLFRPAGYRTVPDGWQYVEAPMEVAIRIPGMPLSRHPYGIIAYERQLTDDEKESYDLEYLGPGQPGKKNPTWISSFSSPIFDGLIEEAVSQYKRLMGRATWTLHLYYQASTETEPGKVLMMPEGQDAPSGYVLADKQPYHGDLTDARLRFRLRAVMGGLPILPRGTGTKVEKNPAGLRKLVATIVKGRWAVPSHTHEGKHDEEVRYSVDPIVSPTGYIYVHTPEYGFRSQAEAERAALEAVKDQTKRLKGEVQVEFRLEDLT